MHQAQGAIAPQSLTTGTIMGLRIFHIRDSLFMMGSQLCVPCGKDAIARAKRRLAYSTERFWEMLTLRVIGKWTREGLVYVG